MVALANSSPGARRLQWRLNPKPETLHPLRKLETLILRQAPDGCSNAGEASKQQLEFSCPQQQVQ